MVAFYFSLGSLIVFSYFSITLLRGLRTIVSLDSLPATLSNISEPLPWVSLIIAARNEEKHVETALRSALALDYPCLEVVFVDDRSSDATPKIVKKLKSEFPALDVLTFKTIPDGWMGKNHALFRGYQQSKGEILLFTDADIVFEPTTLTRALHYFQLLDLDHLTLWPHFTPPQKCHSIRAFNLFFAYCFFLFKQTWKAKRPESKAHIGIGAFNMLRRDTYQLLGTHQAIALRPDDDTKLGELVKQRHKKQDLLFGRPLIQVEFYTSLKEAIVGFNKSFFPGLDYKIWKVLMIEFLIAWGAVWPLAAAVIHHGPTRWINMTMIIGLIFTFSKVAARVGEKKRYAFFYPFSALVFGFIMIRSTVSVLWYGGISWRGQFYSVKDKGRTAFKG